jgi:hypothetical protein
MCCCFRLEKQTSTTSNDIFENTFVHVEHALTEISSDLSTAMSIVFHLRNTYHSLLQGRRAILCDIVLYLSDKSTAQVK